MSKLNAVVSGAYMGKQYAVPIAFSLIPPKGKNFFGNGYTMNVEVDDYTTKAVHYVDVSNSGTIDLERLARIWIKDFYGNTVREIRFDRQEAM